MTTWLGYDSDDAPTRADLARETSAATITPPAPPIPVDRLDFTADRGACFACGAPADEDCRPGCDVIW